MSLFRVAVGAGALQVLREREVVGLSLLSIKMDYRQLVHNISDLQPKFSPFVKTLL